MKSVQRSCFQSSRSNATGFAKTLRSVRHIFDLNTWPWGGQMLELSTSAFSAMPECPTSTALRICSTRGGSERRRDQRPTRCLRRAPRPQQSRGEAEWRKWPTMPPWQPRKQSWRKRTRTTWTSPCCLMRASTTRRTPSRSSASSRSPSITSTFAGATRWVNGGRGAVANLSRRSSLSPCSKRGSVSSTRTCTGIGWTRQRWRSTPERQQLLPSGRNASSHALPRSSRP
mmetsp:Transcript_23395/g.72476  ORF Transcript_23395/g.72476 Transcript_23395/m.72476 type:complete len:229 (+) Transcript_23395:1928-2614(+)